MLKDRTLLFELVTLTLVMRTRSVALAETYTINTANELIEFSNKVNDGTNFTGTTVLLESDIDFSEVTENYTPAGFYSKCNCTDFGGTFNGQGHTISNMKIATNLPEAGLLGYSRGSLIKNIVVDASCTVTGSYVGDWYTYVGGIIGHCEAFDSKCELEGCVNMADITFSGNLSEETAMIGGVTAEYSPYDIGCSIKNCVNYGTITFSGYAKYNTYVAGIAGKLYKANKGYGEIFNCINYGEAISEGKTDTTLFMGGITGMLENGNLQLKNKIDNCASFGSIQNTKATSKQNFTGSIIGQLKNNSASHCYWNESVGLSGVGGKGSGALTENLLFFNSNLVLSDGKSLVTVLNKNAEGTYNWSVVEYHCNGGRIKFFQNLETVKTVETGSPLHLPVKENNKFLGWYTDKDCTQKAVSPLPESAVLYARYGWTISFDANGGTQCQPFTLEYGEYFTLPITTKEGHTFTGWCTEDSKLCNISTVPSHDLNFKATWTANNYTVKFVSDGKTVDEKSLSYGSIIAYPENQTKEGHTFVGWCTEDSKLCNINTVPSRNITLVAVFSENTKQSLSSSSSLTACYVEIVFSSSNISKDEISKIIGEHTEGAYWIETIETGNESEGTRVIVRFKDPEKANEFVRVVNKDRPDEIKSIELVEDTGLSNSQLLYPGFFITLLALAFISF